MFTVEVDLSEFRSARREFDHELNKVMHNGVSFATKTARDTAKRVGPYTDRTGHLRGDQAVIPPIRSGDEVFGFMESPAHYTSFVDKGTSRSRPYPFMSPAFIAAEAALWAYFEREVPKLGDLFNG